MERNLSRIILYFMRETNTQTPSVCMHEAFLLTCVKGLNLINDPTCNKALNVITFCPKCNKSMP